MIIIQKKNNCMEPKASVIITNKQDSYYNYYLSNTTQLVWALLASDATTPQGEAETTFNLTFVCEE